MLPLSEDPKFPTLMQKPGMTTQVCNLSSGAGGEARCIPAACWPDSAVTENKGRKFYISAVTVQTESKGCRRSQPCSSQWGQIPQSCDPEVNFFFLGTHTFFLRVSCQLNFPLNFLLGGSQKSKLEAQWETPAENCSGDNKKDTWHQPLAWYTWACTLVHTQHTHQKIK